MLSTIFSSPLLSLPSFPLLPGHQAQARETVPGVPSAFTPWSDSVALGPQAVWRTASLQLPGPHTYFFFPKTIQQIPNQQQPAITLSPWIHTSRKCLLSNVNPNHRDKTPWNWGPLLSTPTNTPTLTPHFQTLGLSLSQVTHGIAVNSSSTNTNLKCRHWPQPVITCLENRWQIMYGFAEVKGPSRKVVGMICSKAYKSACFLPPSLTYAMTYCFLTIQTNYADNKVKVLHILCYISIWLCKSI